LRVDICWLRDLDLGISLAMLHSCELTVAPVSHGGTGREERRRGSPAVTHRQSRLDASAGRPSPGSRQISTDHTHRSLYRRTWEPRSYPRLELDQVFDAW